MPRRSSLPLLDRISYCICLTHQLPLLCDTCGRPVGLAGACGRVRAVAVAVAGVGAVTVVVGCGYDGGRGGGRANHIRGRWCRHVGTVQVCGSARTRLARSLSEYRRVSCYNYVDRGKREKCLVRVPMACVLRLRITQYSLQSVYGRTDYPAQYITCVYIQSVRLYRYRPSP